LGRRKAAFCELQRPQSCTMQGFARRNYYFTA